MIGTEERVKNKTDKYLPYEVGKGTKQTSPLKK